MLTVVCVLRTGGDFDSTWVTRLERSCFKYLDTHRFICLTDIEGPVIQPRGVFVEWVPLVHKFPGWWSKIELFKPPEWPGGWVHVGDPILYFDLDTVITRNISHLVGGIDCDLTLLRDFYRPQTHFGTGVMGWTAGDFGDIYHQFLKSPTRVMRSHRRGDQSWIQKVVCVDQVRFWQDEFPGHVVSYKVHCQNGLPGDSHVVCFHGKPRPNSQEVKTRSPWMEKKWLEI